MKDVEINGKTYTGISRIGIQTSSGKSYFRDEDEIETSSGSGTEYSVVKTGELNIPESLTTTQTFSFEHGCQRTPDIVVVYSDYKDVFSESNLPLTGYTLVGTGWDNMAGTRYYVIANQSNYNPGSASAKTIGTALEGTMTVDNTQAHIQVTTSRKLDARLTYRYVAICL